VTPALSVKAVKWGQEKEAVALKQYKRQLVKDHQEVTISKSGLRLDENHHYLGASADAVASCKCHGKFLIEIKRPYSHRDAKTVQECVANKDFCLDSNFQLKKTHRYMTQVQMQMYIYKTLICHFIVWTPNFCHSVIVNYDRQFENQVNRLVIFYSNHIVYELITRKIEHEKTCTKKLQTSSERFCYCNQPYNENLEMVGCDNRECPYKWIHYKCAKLKRPPQNSAWYCKECKKKSKSKN
jgi:hypothetical protein